MPINIDLFDSYYLAGVIREIVPTMTFFRDRYFPTDSKTDIFKADKVLVEYMDTDRRLAPFVVPRSGDIPIARKGYEAHEFEAPYIAPSRFLTLDDLRKRGLVKRSMPVHQKRIDGIWSYQTGDKIPRRNMARAYKFQRLRP